MRCASTSYWVGMAYMWPCLREAPIMPVMPQPHAPPQTLVRLGGSATAAARGRVREWRRGENVPRRVGPGEGGPTPRPVGLLVRVLLYAALHAALGLLACVRR